MVVLSVKNKKKKQKKRRAREGERRKRNSKDSNQRGSDGEATEREWSESCVDDSLDRSYKRSFNGFVAKLTERERQRLASECCKTILLYDFPKE